MGIRGLSTPLMALAFGALLGSCGMVTPGMVGSPDGGVVRPFPWNNGDPNAAFAMARDYCNSFHKQPILVEWNPTPGVSHFACVY
jgi:hypothetical protein